MSHPRLNNPRASRVKSAEAARVKRPPRHAFNAERAIEALWEKLTHPAAAPIHRGGCSAVAMMSVRHGINIWCRNNQFIWNDIFGSTFTHPAADPEGAAAEIMRPFTPAPPAPAATQASCCDLLMSPPEGVASLPARAPAAPGVLSLSFA
ncbi:hypothetical protein CLV63_103233 [Murinocardiopsis flavida]|uniref:Uncharacterized protein n=1 Tax=Murinocardiopsis flavida TaxID=645275 RepID=A0A2P8DQM2_9ACTN|nr:hypothetical protein [Murinocardiopsis flavida]PSK99508.1 hypothetical protein CLV63_103233 [Murinocardiopsis flavida]